MPVSAGTEVLEEEMDWVVGANVLSALSARAQPDSCVLCRRLQEATQRERVARFGGYTPAPVSASVKHCLPLFPDLLMKGLVPPR